MVVLHESAITSLISLGRFLFLKLSLISELLIISFSDNVGVLLIFWMVKSVSMFDGRSIRKFFSNDTIMGNQNCVFHHGIIMIPKHFSFLTFAVAAPIRLKGGDA